ncbi:MAG: hypothetical protein QM764_20850 [Chitinophagaceae bacterium]
MPQKRTKNSSLQKTLSGVGKSARIIAFRHKRPVAVSIEGIAYLIYPDGRHLIATQKLLRDLRNGKA